MSLNWTRTHPTDHDLDLTPTWTRTSCLVFSGRVFFSPEVHMLFNILYKDFDEKMILFELTHSKKLSLLSVLISRWMQGCIWLCVINTSKLVSWGDSRGFLGFSVSELTDKCPYMDGFFSNVLTTWPPCWRCQPSPAGHFMQSMQCAARVSTHACQRVGQQETCDWGVRGLLLMWF